MIGRRYFVGLARVPYEAPIERLRLLTVTGKPAIVELPMPEVPGTLRLAVVERFPTSDKPGILTFIDNTPKSLAEAIELAEQIMKAE